MFDRQNIFWTLLAATLLVGCGSQDPAGPPLPRPDPDAALDRIAAQVIRSKAKPLLQAQQDPVRWKEYGDACLMNQWPKEAAVAYTHASLGTTVRNALGTRSTTHRCRRRVPNRR